MRKSLLSFTFLMFCIILALPFASAQNFIISDISSQNFTGIPNKDFEGSFKLTNNVSFDLDINIDYSGLSGLEIKFSDDEVQISSGQSITVEFDIDSEPDDKGVFTGQIFARDDKNNEIFFDVIVNLTLPQNFTGVKIDNVKLDNEEIKFGENLTGFKAGEIIDLQFDLRNLFEEDDDPEIDHLDFDVRIEDISDESSRDLGITIKDSDRIIEPDKIEKFYSKEFRIPHDVLDNGLYKLIIEVDGEDEENENYYIQFEAFIITEKEEKDIGFADVSFDSAKCGETFNVNVELANTGINKVVDGSFIVKIDELGLQKSSQIHKEILENETVSDSVSLDIPLDAKNKTYGLKLITFFKGAEKHSEVHPLTLTCAPPVAQTDNQTTQNNTVSTQNVSINTQQNQETKNETVQANQTKLDEKRLDSIDKDDNKGLILGILLGMVLMIIVLIVLLIYVYKK